MRGMIGCWDVFLQVDACENGRMTSRKNWCLATHFACRARIREKPSCQQSVPRGR